MSNNRNSLWSFLVFSPILLSQVSSIPVAPNLISPRPLDVLDNGCYPPNKNEMVWIFGWSPVPNATSYHLYVIGANALNPAIDNPNIQSTDYIDRSRGYIADQNRMGWRWKVRSKVNGQWSNWSPEQVFHVEPLSTDCRR